jgi:hypothetical protein
MARWTDLATWVGPTPNTSGSITKHMYVVVHTADGSYDGTIAWQKNPAADVSSHFIVAKDGRIAQMLDTTQKGWTQKAGNPYSISIENEGNENTPLTPYQIEACARILARAHQVHGVPLQLTGKVGTPGLGHHSMGYESGVDWGHQFCPGPTIKAQKQAILTRAIEIAGGPRTESVTVPEEDFMAGLTDEQQQDLYRRVVNSDLGIYYGFGKGLEVCPEPLHSGYGVGTPLPNAPFLLVQRINAIQTLLTTLLQALGAGGGSIDVAAITAHADQLAAAEQQREQALLDRIADLEAQVAAARAAAEANLSDAEKAGLQAHGAAN